MVSAQRHNHSVTKMPVVRRCPEARMSARNQSPPNPPATRAVNSKSLEVERDEGVV